MLKRLKKYLIIGSEQEKDAFFQIAQKVGVVEFINCQPAYVKEVPETLHNALQAIKILRAVPPVKHQKHATYPEMEDIVKRIVACHRQIEHLSEEKRMLFQEIIRVEAFGPFSKEEIARIEEEAHCAFQFFHAKPSLVKSSDDLENVLFIGYENGLNYYLAVNSKSRNYPGLIEMEIDRPVNVLKERYKLVDQEVHVHEKELKELNSYNQACHKYVTHLLDIYHLSEAKRFSLDILDKSLFAITGWMPPHKKELLEKAMGNLAIHVEEVSIETADREPTYMENKGTSRIGEDLVRIYDIPSITDRDPSPWVIWAFALFFAMIVNDAGYGLIFLATALFCYYRFRKAKPVGKRTIRLGLIICSACIIWGFLTSSFFGITLPQNSWVKRYSLINYLTVRKANYHLQQKDDVYNYWLQKYPAIKDATTAKQFLDDTKTVQEGKTVYAAREKFSDNIMFELALFIGTIHIIISFLRYADRNWSGVGWIIFMVGGYIYFPYMLNATSLLNYGFTIHKSFAAKYGLYIVYGGIAIAWGLSIIQRRLSGLADIMHVVQIFGDVLSYLRLYALGLAGAMVAVTFNQMAVDVGWGFGFLILIVGHAVNITLGIMSGVIHGLRLNFLEWYHYSFEGGGRLFNPLKLLS